MPRRPNAWPEKAKQAPCPFCGERQAYDEAAPSKPILSEPYKRYDLSGGNPETPQGNHGAMLPTLRRCSVIRKLDCVRTGDYWTVRRGLKRLCIIALPTYAVELGLQPSRDDVISAVREVNPTADIAPDVDVRFTFAR